MYGVGAVMWRMVAGGNPPWEPSHPVRVEQRSHAALGGTEDPMPSARELGEGRFPSQMLEVIDAVLAVAGRGTDARRTRIAGGTAHGKRSGHIGGSRQMLRLHQPRAP